MILIQGELGTGSFVISPKATLRETIDLSQPITKYCRALLRGFELVNTPGDRKLQDMRVQLHCGFGNDLQQAEITAEVILADAHGHGTHGTFDRPDWETIRFVVYYTIVGE